MRLGDPSDGEIGPVLAPILANRSQLELAIKITQAAIFSLFFMDLISEILALLSGCRDLSILAISLPLGHL